MLYILTLFVVAFSRNCGVEFPKAGLSHRYNESIAHAIHSMTLDVVRRFQPTIGLDNKVPTVNMNISSIEKVIYASPERLPRNGFVDREMHLVDMILSQIDTPNDGLGPNWSPLERIVHRFHMEDLWSKIETTFKKTAKPSKAVCQCLYDDVKTNGVYDAVMWVAEHYESGTPITLLGRAIPKLKNAKTWSIWRDRLLEYYDEASVFDASLYLHCIPIKYVQTSLIQKD